MNTTTPTAPVAQVKQSHCKSIGVRYVGPTNYKGSRLIADDGGRNRVTVSYDYGLNHDELYASAALALMAKMGWTGTLIQGGGVGKYAAVFVFEPSEGR